MPSEEEKSRNEDDLSTGFEIVRLVQNCSNDESTKLKTNKIDNTTKESELENKNVTEQITKEDAIDKKEEDKLTIEKKEGDKQIIKEKGWTTVHEKNDNQIVDKEDDRQASDEKEDNMHTIDEKEDDRQIIEERGEDKQRIEEKSHQDASKIKPFRIEDEPTRLTDEDGWLDILGSGDLKKKVIKAGEGINSRAQRGQWVTMHYTGKLENGNVIEEENNLNIIVGDSDVVQGLDLSVALMEKGEIAEIIVPSRLAYGKLGNPPHIPPDAVIHYEVEILDIKEAEDEERLSLSERQRIGNEKRERGNFWYTRGEYSTAVHCYRRALDFLDDEHQNFQEPASELQKLLDTRLIVYNNLAAAQLKMDAYEAALKSVDFVLTIQPNNVKALFRKGKILASKGQIDEAIDVLRKALKLEPETKIIHQELSKLTSRKKKEETETRAMYKRMFETKIDKQKHEKKHQLLHWSIVAGSVLTIACAIVLYKQMNSSG